MNLKFIYLLVFFTVSLSSIAQTNLKFSIEYSPHLSAISNLEQYSTAKLSHAFSTRLDFAATERMKFTGSLGILGTGSKNIEKYEPKKETRNFNYAMITLGTKMYYKNIYLSPEVGFGVFINQIYTGHYEDRIIKEIKYSYDIDYFAAASKTSMMTSLTFGYEFRVFQRLVSCGMKGYFFIEKFKNENNDRSIHPYGVGLNLGYYL